MRVVRKLNPVNGGECRWVVQDETGGHMSILQSWTERVEEGTEREAKNSGTDEKQRVNAATLLKLAKMVETLSQKGSAKGESHVNKEDVGTGSVVSDKGNRDGNLEHSAGGAKEADEQPDCQAGDAVLERKCLQGGEA
ncbi:MAG: hypothetical protein ACK5NN_04255 [Sphingomonadaceae bacterium]